MAQGWSVDGRRVQLGAAFPAGKIVVLENGASVHEQKLSGKGQWPLSIGGAPFELKRTKGFMGPKTDLFNERGEKIPLSAKHVVPAPAVVGSLCAVHSAAARFACARCGAFACPQCAGADLTHCKGCSDRLGQEAAKNAAAMAYFAPTVVLAVLGGALLGLLGAAAGAGAVAIARRTESKPLKILAAVGLYGLAVVSWVVAVMMIKG